ncbi:MAG TPA: ATP-dependent zinc protease [Kiloniellales bacterium]|nr:ATP-dependent zinc protease [Kiloniellales bacterium]
MRQGLLPFGAFTLALVLIGCAGADPSPQALDAEAVAARVERLEQSVSHRCDLAGSGFEQNRELLLQFGDRLHETTTLLGHLRADVARLEQAEPATLVECPGDGLDLDDKVVVGRAEWVGLPDLGTYLKARVDSGANTSSLSATEITDFERDGETWVRFKLGLVEDDVVVDEVRDEWIERPVERRVRILQAAGEESRPVISLMMTLGPIQERVEFTLNDRTHLSYPVLLGRRFLMDIAVIDVAEIYLHERPVFPGGRPSEEAGLDEADDRDDVED